MSELPPGVTIAPPPPELRLGDDDHFEGWGTHYRRPTLSAIQAAKAFPKPIEVDAPEALRTQKQFACSGGLDSTRYREATKFRAPVGMYWEEARIALNRLLVPVRYDGGKSPEYVALAEFVLSVVGFSGFVGLRGEHAVKLRDALGDAIVSLHRRLDGTLGEGGRQDTLLARPITLHGDMRGTPESVANSIAGAFWTMVPTGDDWVQIIEATPIRRSLRSISCGPRLQSGTRGARSRSTSAAAWPEIKRHCRRRRNTPRPSTSLTR
jgi:hypothetical protein